MRRGNEGAFEVLFERYRSRLLGFCRQMLHSSEDAEDVLQEVFVAAHKAILADEREINVRPWLYRIARNRSLNHLRRQVPDGQDTMDDRPFEHGTSTSDRVEKREEFRELLTDVTKLPETQKTALLLREIDAMSYDEIGAAMDTTVPSVKSLLVRARVSLAEASEARALTCSDVRIELAEAAEGLGRASGPVRRHIRECEDCKGFRAQLRSDRKALAALFPVGPLVALKGLLFGKLAGAGAGGSASSSASAGAAGAAAGSSGGISGAGAIGGAIAAKATAGVVTAALLTAGAVEMKRAHHRVEPVTPKVAITKKTDASAVPSTLTTPVPAAAPSSGGSIDSKPSTGGGGSGSEPTAGSQSGSGGSSPPPDGGPTDTGTVTTPATPVIPGP